MTQYDFFERPPDVPVRALSFLRPWGEAIIRPPPPGASVRGAKRIDNRRRAPPRSLVGGGLLAIHTSQGVARDAFAWLREHVGYDWSVSECAPAGVLLGVVRLDGVIEPTAPNPAARLGHGASPDALTWWFGRTHRGAQNFGWVLGAVWTFPTPRVVGGGALGCWRLAADDEAAVRALVATPSR